MPNDMLKYDSSTRLSRVGPILPNSKATLTADMARGIGRLKPNVTPYLLMECPYMLKNVWS